MTSRPWMPLYIGDFLADTVDLNATETGAYLLLIFHCWHNDGAVIAVPHAMARIARVYPQKWPKVWSKLERFFVLKSEPVGGTHWLQKRVRHELDHVADISQKRANAANSRHSKSITNEAEMHTHARATSHSQLQSSFLNAPKNQIGDLKSEAEFAVVWVNEDQPTFRPLADRWLSEKGKAAVARGSRNGSGLGFYFPANWLPAQGGVALSSSIAKEAT